MRTIPLGEEYLGHFPVFAADGVAKQSGVDVFVATVWRDGAVVAAPVTVAEIGVSGEYTARFVPTLAGVWGVEVLTPSTGERWGEDVVVATPALQFAMTAADDNATLTLGVWAESAGARQTDLTSIAARLRTEAGALVADLGTQATDDGQGVFAFAFASASVVAGEYYLDITATRGGATWYANLGLSKV
jgi:hypothetical protein